MSDLDFNLARSLNCTIEPNGAAEIPTYDFLLVSNSNHMPSYLSPLSCFRDFSAYLLSLGEYFVNLPPPSPPPHTQTPQDPHILSQGQFLESNHF